MDIQINANYKITSDERNIIVNRRFMVDPTKSPNWAKRQAEGADPTPKEKWREVTYHGRIEQALNSIIDQQIRDSEAEQLSELVAQIKGFQREISEVMGRRMV
jgi:hypothetical protein